jgi:glucan phosphoethanolaminetransferase (alkaline phosphatase superfamily)
VLDDQEQAMKIVNKEIEDIKKNKLRVENEILKKNKEVQINEYYGLYYQSHAYIFKIIVVGCLIIIFILLLKKNYILPEKLAWFFIILVIFVVIILISKKSWNLYWRNESNFNEYDWYFDKSAY